MAAELAEVDQAEEPHPEAKVLQERMAESFSGPPQSPEERRAAQRERALADLDPEPVAAVSEVVVRSAGHGLPLRVYEPEAAGTRPVLVWAHGGAFVLGDLDTEDETARALANATGRVVVSVDYRLAPEHPFPAQLEDFAAAVEWAAEEIADYGGDPDRIAVGGQSAGATLSASTALYFRDHGGPDLEHQVLVVPVVSLFEDFTDESDDDEDLPDSDFLAHPLHGKNPYAYPIEAADVSDLPPASVLTAGFDERRFQGRAYADRLADAGVAVDHHHYPDTVHFFFGQFGADEWDVAREAVGDVAADLEGPS